MSGRVDGSDPRGGYPPIASYGFISDGQTGALVGEDGSIDWLCAPRFDGPSVFARILDLHRGGSFSLRPVGPGWQRDRRYVPDTNVLETTWESAAGRAVVWDFLSLEMEGPHGPGEVYAHGNLIRLIECREGEIELEARIAPRPDYARSIPEYRRAEHGIEVLGGAQPLNLRSDQQLERHGHDLIARFRLAAVQAAVFALRYDGTRPVREITPALAREALDRSVRSWQQWSRRCQYEGEHREQVLRSALVLKGLIYHRSGALLAAPTTSLPETIGGQRNWDYRYMWFRDATLTLLALFRLGYAHEAHDFMDFMLDSCAICGQELRLMLGVGGEHDLPESTLDHLEGYARSAPVRIGNRAHEQLQLDTYGEVLDACWLYHKISGSISDEQWQLLRRLIEFVCENWQRPDNGIWEVRGALQQFTHSKVMCWVALDRGIRLAYALGDDGVPERWEATREAIRAQVLARGYDRERHSFVQSYGAKALDASTLRLSHVGFLAGDDPRMLATIDLIREELEVDGLVYRYRVEETDDGLHGREGAFVMCSFWLVSSLALAGRCEEAQALLADLLARANDLGLYSEELAPDGTMLGNFPQAFTHLALIQAVANVEAAQQGAERLRSWATRESWR
jgi:GH15 family glucan-1,4-alpha-glucosidase